MDDDLIEADLPEDPWDEFRDDHAQLDGSMNLLFITDDRFNAFDRDPLLVEAHVYERYESAVTASEPAALVELIGEGRMQRIDADILMAHVPVEVLAPRGAQIWQAALEAQLVVINELGSMVVTDAYDLRVDVADIPEVGALDATFKDLVAFVKASPSFRLLHKGGVGSGTGQGWWMENDEWVGAMSVGRDRGRGWVATSTALAPREVWDAHARDRFGDPGYGTFGWGIYPVSRTSEFTFTQITFISRRAVSRRTDTAHEQLSKWLEIWVPPTEQSPQTP